VLQHSSGFVEIAGMVEIGRQLVAISLQDFANQEEVLLLIADE
jgi:hypothetical protein